MAKKARFFKVNIQDGHGKSSFYMAAQSKAALINKLEIPSTVKMLSAENLGFHKTSVAPDEEMGCVEFIAIIEGQEIKFKDDAYLMQQFPSETKKAEEMIEEYHNPDF